MFSVSVRRGEAPPHIRRRSRVRVDRVYSKLSRERLFLERILLTGTEWIENARSAAYRDYYKVQYGTEVSGG